MRSGSGKENVVACSSTTSERRGETRAQKTRQNDEAQAEEHSSIETRQNDEAGAEEHCAQPRGTCAASLTDERVHLGQRLDARLHQRGALGVVAELVDEQLDVRTARGRAKDKF